MTLRFDTGLPRSTRELIVGAVTTKLAALKRPTKYLTAIVPLSKTAAGKADEEFVIDFVRAANGRAPCIGIATGDVKSESASEDGLEMFDTLELGIYVASTNQRTVIDGRLFVDVGAATDDTKDPGVFAILQHIVERIQGQSLGLEGVQPPFRSDEGEVITGEDFTIWGQTYSVRICTTINPDRDATTVMTSIEARHKGDGIPDGSALDPLIDTVTSLDPPT